LTGTLRFQFESAEDIFSAADIEDTEPPAADSDIGEPPMIIEVFNENDDPDEVREEDMDETDKQL
jgi:hypothetical protein